jgi:predicted RecA/RadA family phage recombinase
MAVIRFKSGNTETINYTPGSDTAAGTTVTIGVLVGVTHRAIAANKQGALHVGGGVYTGPGNAAIAAGVVVYYDTATSKFTATAGALKKFGVAVTACSGDAADFDVLHVPNNA